jgi:hypothetical protein
VPLFHSFYIKLKAFLKEKILWHLLSFILSKQDPQVFDSNYSTSILTSFTSFTSFITENPLHWFLCHRFRFTENLDSAFELHLDDHLFSVFVFHVSCFMFYVSWILWVQWISRIRWEIARFSRSWITQSKDFFKFQVSSFFLFVSNFSCFSLIPSWKWQQTKSIILIKILSLGYRFITLAWEIQFVFDLEL